MTGSIVIPTLAVLLLSPPGTADAQTHAGVVKSDAAVPAGRPSSPAIRESLANLDFSAIELSPRQPPPARPALQAASGKPQRSMARKVVGGAIGAAAGFFIGRHLGAAVGGYGGYKLGGPAGAIVGGILGAKF